MTEYPVLCAMEARCRSGPRPTNGAWVCDPCADDAARAFRRIADQWDDLTVSLVASTSSHGGERGRQRNGAINHPLPYNEAAFAVRQQATTTTWHAVRTVLAVRPAAQLPDDVGIPALCRWIADWHIPDLVTRPGRYTTLAIVDDARRVAGRVGAVMGQRRWHRRPVGVPCDSEECPGSYTALVGDGISMDLVCDADPDHFVPAAEWQRHGWIRRHRPVDLSRLVARGGAR